MGPSGNKAGRGNKGPVPIPSRHGRPRRHPEQGHPPPVSQRVSRLVWLTGITRGSAARCDANPGTAQAAPPCPASGSAAMEGKKINRFLFPLFPAIFTFRSHCRTELQVGRTSPVLLPNPHWPQALTRKNCKNKSENDLPRLKSWAQLESKQPCTALHLTLPHGHRPRADFFLFKAGGAAPRPPPRGCRSHCHALPGYF